MKNPRPILLVEDDRVDAMAVKRAHKELKITNDLVTRGNGEEAIEYLQDTSNEKPCLILLDLHMPKMGGMEFLQKASDENLLNSIPVVILTTSREEQNIADSFNLGVSGYMIKPVGHVQLIEIIKTIHMYWTLSQIPE